MRNQIKISKKSQQILQTFLDKLKQKLPQLEVDLNEIHKFKDFYHFTFNYAKDQGQKGLDLDMAIAYWNIVLKDRFKFLDLWCKFLTVRCEIFPGILSVTFPLFRKIINEVSQKIRGIYYSTLLSTSTTKCPITTQRELGEFFHWGDLLKRLGFLQILTPSSPLRDDSFKTSGIFKNFDPLFSP